MIFNLMDKLARSLDRGKLRGRLRKTFLYVIWKWLRAIPMFFDYRMVNLYSRKSFRDQLDDKECSNWISLWLQSYQKPPETLTWVLDLKDPVPWVNFKAIHYMEFFLMNRKGPVVFEYGTGASTLWFAKRAAKVVSVESSTEWHSYVSEILKKRNIDNVNYNLGAPQTLSDHNTEERKSLVKYQSGFEDYKNVHFKNFVNTITKSDELYDLIFIDGEARPACMELAKLKVKDNGIIVLDNSSRERYQKAINDFSDWKTIRISGPVSYGELIEETTIFRRYPYEI